MRIMAKMLTFLLFGALATSASADWFPSDGHKMHFPQLPDPLGWDVNTTNLPGQFGVNTIADDWQCSGSGFVRDFHFWGSWRGDVIGQITNVHLSIHDDIPDPDGSGPQFSMPGNLLWEFDTDIFNILPVDPPSSQGWFDPTEGSFFEDDHSSYFQYNIIDIPNPFYQEQGRIYWLDISVTVLDAAGTQWGWKTSLDHWNDDAVFLDASGAWHELLDPLTGESLDMAFVITPAPGALTLLAMAAVAGQRRRRRLPA